jgi:hypothetical protein
MKIKIDYNEKPLVNFILGSMSIITDIRFTEEKSYRICKKTWYPMTVTTDIIEPIKDALISIAKLAVKFHKEVNADTKN